MEHTGFFSYQAADSATAEYYTTDAANKVIAFANGDYDKYNNGMQMFNKQLNELTEWYARTYSPADQ